MKTPFQTALFILLSFSAFAQNPAGLTSRENLDPYTYKQGTRPTANTFGFYLSTSLLDLQNRESVSPLSYLNFRYYLAEDLVLRAGLKLTKTKETSSGESDEELGGPESFKEKTSDRSYALVAGIEKHFTPNNLVDVYVAADVRGGIRRFNFQEDSKPVGGDASELFISRQSNDYGAGAYIGFQTFIADLPLALSVEAGFQGIGSIGQRAKVTETIAGQTEEYQVLVDKDLEQISETAYKNVSTKRFELDATLRINLCYFFNR